MEIKTTTEIGKTKKPEFAFVFGFPTKRYPIKDEMKGQFFLTARPSNPDMGNVLLVSIEGEMKSAPWISISCPDSGYELTSWRADRFTSRISIRRFAAALREIETWTQCEVEIPGDEWRDGYLAPVVSFTLDCGEVQSKTWDEELARMSIRVLQGDGLLLAHSFRAPEVEMARFGREIPIFLQEYHQWHADELDQ